MLKLGDSGRYPGLKEEMAAAVMRAMGERNVGPGVNGGVAGRDVGGSVALPAGRGVI